MKSIFPVVLACCVLAGCSEKSDFAGCCEEGAVAVTFITGEKLRFYTLEENDRVEDYRKVETLTDVAKFVTLLNKRPNSVRSIYGFNHRFFDDDYDWGPDQIKKRLVSITIPSSVKKIGKKAFLGCSSLKSITIPSSVEEIEEQAFLGCSSLESVTIPPSVKEIGRYAFQDCISLESVTILSSVKEIGRCAFRDCISLKSVTIPSSVKEIGKAAFAGCASLKSITIPSSVELEIEESAFEHCSSLKSVTIPSNVKRIGRYVFNLYSSVEVGRAA